MEKTRDVEVGDIYFLDCKYYLIIRKWHPELSDCVLVHFANKKQPEKKDWFYLDQIYEEEKMCRGEHFYYADLKEIKIKKNIELKDRRAFIREDMVKEILKMLH